MGERRLRGDENRIITVDQYTAGLTAITAAPYANGRVNIVKDWKARDEHAPLVAPIPHNTVFGSRVMPGVTYQPIHHRIVCDMTFWWGPIFPGTWPEYHDWSENPEAVPVGGNPIFIGPPSATPIGQRGTSIPGLVLPVQYWNTVPGGFAAEIQTADFWKQRIVAIPWVRRLDPRNTSLDFVPAITTTPLTVPQDGFQVGIDDFTGYRQIGAFVGTLVGAAYGWRLSARMEWETACALERLILLGPPVGIADYLQPGGPFPWSHETTYTVHTIWDPVLVTDETPL